MKNKKILSILLMATSMQVYSQQLPIIEVSAEVKAIDNETFVIYKLHNPSKQNVYFIPSSIAPDGMQDIETQQGVDDCFSMIRIRRDNPTLKDATTILPQQTINEKINLTELFSCEKNLNSTYRIYYDAIQPSFNYSKEFIQKYYGNKGEKYDKFIDKYHKHIDFKF